MYLTAIPLPTAPTSGETITLVDSANLGSPLTARRVKLSLRSSHASGTDGLTFEVLLDQSGTTWRTYRSYTHPAATSAVPFSRYDLDMSFRRWRIRYTNSANTLTSWEGEILLTDEFAAA